MQHFTRLLLWYNCCCCCCCCCWLVASNSTWSFKMTTRTNRRRLRIRLLADWPVVASRVVVAAVAVVAVGGGGGWRRNHRRSSPGVRPLWLAVRQRCSCGSRQQCGRSAADIRPRPGSRKRRPRRWRTSEEGRALLTSVTAISCLLQSISNQSINQSMDQWIQCRFTGTPIFTGDSFRFVGGIDSFVFQLWFVSGERRVAPRCSVGSSSSGGAGTASSSATAGLRMASSVRMTHGFHVVVVFVTLVAAGQLVRCFQRFPVHTCNITRS